MKIMSLLFLLITTLFLRAQNIMNEKSLEFINDGSNLQAIQLSSDSNATSFAILIRDSVKAHYHEKHTESLMVLNGEAEMKLGDSILTVKKGDFFVIPPRMIHAVKVTSSEPLKVISVQAPEFLGKDRVWVD